MRLVEIWRHPVKSLQGERLAEARIEPDGLAGDRCWGIRDNETGKVLTGRREPELLFARGHLTAEGQPTIELPAGAALVGTGSETDAALSAWLRRDVSLVAANEVDPGVGEFFADATDDSSEAIEWTMPPGRFVDLLPILVLTTASLRAGKALHRDGNWDVRRFRPNLFVEVDGDGWLEDDWCGGTARIGEVVLAPRSPCVRCTMVTRPQPGLEHDLDIYRTIARDHDGNLGVWSEVVQPGVVRAGDPVEVTGR